MSATRASRSEVTNLSAIAILKEKVLVMRSRFGSTLVLAVTFLSISSSSLLNSQPTRKRELTVFAAASLTEAFQSLGKSFESAHPSIKLIYNFGGSQQLVRQIIQGADADVFASADMKQMNFGVTAGVIDTDFIRIFARNELVIILPSQNPAHLNALKDLAQTNIKIVLADPSVPVGQYSVKFLDRCSSARELGEAYKADVLRNVVSYEENVRAVLSKVQLGECDAGIVYTSDIAHDTLHKVLRIDIPDSLNIIAEYPIAVVHGSRSPQTAREFLDYILSDEGVRVMASFGFAGVIPLHR